MKRFALMMFAALSLFGCNTDGFEELPSVYVRNNYPNGGTSSTGAPTTGNSSETASSNWEYKSISNDKGVFDATATVHSINQYKMVGYDAIKGYAFAVVEREKSNSGVVTEKVSIYASTDIDCANGCNLRVRSNSNQTFRFINGISTVVTGADIATNKKLYDIFTNSNTVIVELPLKNEPMFPAEFDTRNFDRSKMLLWGEGGTNAPASSNTTPSANPFNPVSTATCDSFKGKTCTQMTCTEAKIALDSCNRKDLDTDDDGKVCEKQCS